MRRLLARPGHQNEFAIIKLTRFLSAYFLLQGSKNLPPSQPPHPYLSRIIRRQLIIEIDSTGVGWLGPLLNGNRLVARNGESAPFVAPKVICLCDSQAKRDPKGRWEKRNIRRYFIY